MPLLNFTSSNFLMSFCFSLDDSFDIDGENRKYGHDYISIKFRFPPSYLPPEYMKKQMHKAMEEL